MRILPLLPLLILVPFAASAAHTAGHTEIDKYYDSSEAASDRDDGLTDSGIRLHTQPGLRECTMDADCTAIEGVCPGKYEAVNITRKDAKLAANLNARSVASCEPVENDPRFGVVGSACVENECVIIKKRN